MLTGTQPFPQVALPPTSLEVLSIPRLLDNSEPLQTLTPKPTVLPSYPENDYHWLVGVLDELIEFMRRDENRGGPALIENDYDWAHALLVELVDAVGESETHPLRPLMEFVCQLIDNYEDKYVPELTELFPELAEEETAQVPANENRQPVSNLPKQSENVLAVHAFFSMGYLLYQGNRREKALSAYNMTITLKPDSWEAFYNRGIVRHNLGQYAEAMTDFNQVIELNYNFASAYHNRGILKSELKDYESAIADFDKAVELKPDCVEVYNILGILRSELGQYDKALADYAEAIRIKPDDAEAYAYRGVLKAHLGRIDEARSDFQKALGLAKRHGNNDLKVFAEESLQELNN